MVRADHDVQPTIVVQVAHSQRVDGVGDDGHGAHGIPRAVEGSAVVFIDVNAISAIRVVSLKNVREIQASADDQVQIAVIVQVGQRQSIHGSGGIGERTIRPGSTKGRAIVLPHLQARSRTGTRHHIRSAVVIQVADGNCPDVTACRTDVRRIPCAVKGRAIVLPGNHVHGRIAAGAGYHVRVAIPIQVNNCQGVDVVRTGAGGAAVAIEWHVAVE